MKNHAGKILCALFLCTNIFGAEWFCDSFQYRLTLETEVDKPGWHEIAIPSGMLVDKASELSGFKFRMESFSPNRVILTQVGATGEKKFDNAGYYLLTSDREAVPVGLKLPANKGDGGGAYEKDGMLQHLVKDRFGKQIAVPVKGGQLYLCRFRNSGGGSSPTYLYEPTHDKGSRLRKYNYDISYIPRLLPQAETDFEVLVRPDVNGKRWTAYFYRKQDIQFIAGNGNPDYNSNYLSIGAPHGQGDNINFRGQCNTMYADGHAAGFNWKNVKNKYYAPFAYQDINGNVWDADMWE